MVKYHTPRLCLALAVFVFGCAALTGCTAPEQNQVLNKVPSQKKPSYTCPYASMPVSGCSNKSVLGLSPTNPAEWGMDGGGKTLWFGRLTCASGAIPKIVREKTYGRAPSPSTSSASPSTEGTLDVLDQWLVSCPDKASFRLFHNIYRCGDPCPPGLLKLMPSNAFEHYKSSQRALQNQSINKAVELAKKAYQRAPYIEVLILWYALVLTASNEHQSALMLYERALAINPNSISTALRRLEALLVLKRHKEVIKLGEQLLKKVEDRHTQRPYLLCLYATSLATEDTQRAALLSQRACQLGELGCCP